MPSSNVSRIKQTTQRGFCASLLIAALALGVTGPAQASLLNLTPETPDIFSSFTDISYVDGTDTLVAKGTALTVDDDGVGAPEGIVGGTFDLSAIIDDVGSLSGGSIIIGGTVASIGANSGTLLTGTLTDIGFKDAGGGDPLEFLFSVTGGDLAGLYGGTGGIILTGTGFTSWVTSFQNASSTGMSDTFTVSPVPVPAAVWLFGSALLGLAGFGRHSRRKQG
jgi:hypothetical protein